jgi:hypothetical protein
MLAPRRTKGACRQRWHAGTPDLGPDAAVQRLQGKGLNCEGPEIGEPRTVAGEARRAPGAP